MKVAVVLPTYNERENIDRLLQQLLSVLGSILSHSFSIVFVDDDSPDKTADIVRLFQKKHPEIHLLHGRKRGLGVALLRGMAYADDVIGADVIIQMDADLSHDPAVIREMVSEVEKGADFIVGSRYIPGGSIPANWGYHRKLFSVLGNAIVRFGLGKIRIHDWTGGFRAYKSHFYRKSRDQMGGYSGYVFQIAFLYKSVLAGARIVEIPIHFTDRKYGKSKLATGEYIKNVLTYVFQSRLSEVKEWSFWKFAVVGTIGFIINTIILELIVYIGYHPTLGSILGAETAIVSNFLLNNSWTFKNRKITGSSILYKFLQFNATSVGAILLQFLTVLLGTVFVSLELYRLWYIAGVGLGLIWNFKMYSKVIWKNSGGNGK
ncbi:hypothetical protein A2154_03570 [Candidatus Gottesmanbacteria bacterium RBG_16_43_7]|uniref:Dolichyl-phosphate beta-D-mannosyltransferase n=1 Tax=Candidatus Gottesmanbacteria bacterium RBG_16_43_7 TaxID=1798373 RepID=A0A1F5Z7A3_9BACT|nr:MAG: hypothetical protein A2154_03570 [Candidatus Gottesmanbacteria bacterium RBG_16_43_7]